MRRYWWWVGGVTLVVLLVVLVVGAKMPGSFWDLRVYRSGGAAWMHGVPLYTNEFPSRLPFTYPPVAAVLFSVLAMLPMPAAATVLTLAGLVALSLTTTLATSTPAISTPATPARETSARVAGPDTVTGPVAVAGPVTTAGPVTMTEPVAMAGPVAVVCALAVEPVRSTLWFGQVNLVLMGLVAVDCLLPRTRYPRGLLIGIAAAVKLTPAIFVLFFLARRQYPPVVTAIATFVGATGFGMLLAPADSVMYWHTAVFDADRIGGAAFATNQSLRGALDRLGLGQGVWVVLVIAVLVLAWHGARRARDPVVALLLVAAAGLLVSPVSWSHHWVWVVPAVTAFAVRTSRRFRPAIVLPATVAVFAVGHRFLPHARDRELEWTWWQHVVGNSYLLAALAFLVWSVAHRRAVPHVGGDRTLVSAGERG